MPKVITLAESQITKSSHDTLTIELIEFDDKMPATVKIAWPLQPSVIDPDQFRDAAAAVVRLFSEAHVALARAKARRLL